MIEISNKTLPANEVARLAALHECRILGTDQDDRYDEIAEMAAEIAGATMASISFVSEDTAWPKTEIGFTLGEVPRNGSFANVVISSEVPTIIEDGPGYLAYRDLDVIASWPYARLCAGVPIITRSGFIVGSLSVFDPHAKILNPVQVRLLQYLAEVLAFYLQPETLDVPVEAISAESAERAESPEKAEWSEQEKLRQEEMIESLLQQIAELRKEAESQSSNEPLSADLEQAYHESLRIIAALEEEKDRQANAVEVLQDRLEFLENRAARPTEQTVAVQVSPILCVPASFEGISVEPVPALSGSLPDQGLSLSAPASAYGQGDEIARLEREREEQARVIVDLRKQIAELEEDTERYILAANSANDGIWDWDLKTNKIFYDERWRQMLGCEEGDEFPATMDGWMDRIHPEDAGQFKAEIESNIVGLSSTFRNEHRLMHKSGEYRWILARGLTARNGNGSVYRMAGAISDITDSKGAEQQLLHNAFHDVLTGLPNRALFMDRLKRSLNRAKHRPDYMFAALFLDLDRFKVINDSLGHQVGDELLNGIARRLEKCMRPGDMIARLGGDEFAVIIDNLKGPEDALQAAERLHEEISTSYELSGREVYASASIGIALSHAQHDTAEDFLRAADTAMYHAKNKGRGCVELFDTEMHAKAVGQLQIETDLRRALQRNEFRVLYQPIVATRTRQVRGFEALIRWEHPEQGMIPPAKFIAVAEETGLIIPIDLWVLRESCLQLKEWQQEFPMNPLLSVSVNLSGKQFGHPDLCEKIRAILDETGVIPLSVKLEITESSLVENPDAAAQILRQLKDLGVRISLDDFGTGYSSLSYLHRFPIDVLKIDRSFVNRLSISKNSEIVRTIITLAINLGMEVIAEGVETDEQVSQLEGMNCDYVQGYLFSQPITNANIHDLLALTYPKIAGQNVASA